VGHHVEDAHADRHVQHTDWLVGQDHLGLDGQGTGESDALALPAGELVGELERHFLGRRQPHRP